MGITDNSKILFLTMPLGLSYYIFKAISYLADIFKLKRSPENSFINYIIYISLFPQIICGPIVRSDEITAQLHHKLGFHKELFQQGLLLILSGLFKKLVIADRLNPYVSSIFSNPIAYPSIALWLSAFFYTVQIYCDFAGYSEIAIGVTNLLGIKCSKNFNLPYFSANIKEFWKRWHISLSSWLLDYIYIPLGGNRISKFRTKVNILITFAISGLWHGSGLHFILWGLWHGILNIFSFKVSDKKFICVLQTIFTFICVMLGWILFRSQSIYKAFIYIKNMFVGFSISLQTIVASIFPFSNDYSCFSYFLTVILFIFVLFIFEFREYTNSTKNNLTALSLKYIIYLVSLIFFCTIGQSSFLYANF